MPNSTIIARTSGGLGNQLFVYAAARRIAQERGAELLLDTLSAFQRDKYGAIDQLGHFAITTPRAPRSDCFVTPLGRRKRELLWNLSKRLGRDRKFMVKEQDFVTSPGAEPDFSGPLRRKVRVEGYWQSLRYFRPIETEIRSELRVTTPLSAASLEVSREINAVNAVCLHIRQRRGKAMVPGMVAPATLPQLPFSYYERAVEQMAAMISDPVFFCFGDDADFMPQRWDFPYPVRFVTHNASQESAFEDFALMTQCRHFIAANSTFSWWAAFLGSYPEKRVIAPKSQGALTWSSEADTILDSWIALDP